MTDISEPCRERWGNIGEFDSHATTPIILVYEAFSDTDDEDFVFVGSP